MPRWPYDPVKDAPRRAAASVALQRLKPWEKSTGPKTLAGRRKMAENATQHGAGSLAFRLAVAYCDAVLVALDQNR